MKKNNITSTLASVLLLLTAALGTTGCTQNDDAPDGASLNSQSITVRIAPKAGFAEGNTQTRSTVNADDGTFAWAADDVIYVVITFKNQSNSTLSMLCHKWKNITGNTNATESYLSGDWDAFEQDGTTPVSKLIWPAGATKADVKALYAHTNYEVANDNITVEYGTNGATGDIMTFNSVISRGEALEVALKHDVARLTFTGLTPETGYKLKGVLHITTYRADLTSSASAEQTFTSDDTGKLTFCAPLNIKKSGTSLPVTLQTAAGEDVYTANLPVQGDPAAVNGYMYTLNAVASGGTAPDSSKDLLMPKPIAEGSKVWEVNGYWVTAPPYADVEYLNWNEVMKKKPCASGAWRLPTMDDFQKIFGFSPAWSPDADEAGTADNSALLSVDKDMFPNSSYWSSTPYAINPSEIWCVSIHSNQTSFWHRPLLSSHAVRCVQLK